MGKVVAWGAGLLLLALVLLAGWTRPIWLSAWNSWQAQPARVSIIQLVADPGRRDGAIVRTIGYLHLEFEGDMICPTREFYEKRAAQDCLWIDAPPSAASLSDHYVIVQGRFSAKDRGHLSMFSGALGQVTRIEPWPPADRVTAP